MFITTAEFNGLSSTTYEKGILDSEWKILAKIHVDILISKN